MIKKKSYWILMLTAICILAVTGCKKEGKTADYEHLVPDYMRKAEAEQKLEAGELPICKGPRQE